MLGCIIAQHLREHIWEIIFLSRTPVQLRQGFFQGEDFTQEDMAENKGDQPGDGCQVGYSGLQVVVPVKGGRGKYLNRMALKLAY